MEKLFELIIDEEDESGVSMIALVDLPAIERDFQMFNAEFQESYDDYPESASNNAAKALRWIDEYEDEINCNYTRTGLARANQLKNGDALSWDTIGRMASFNRHRANAEVNAEYKDTPWKDCGYLAWLLWGGTSGINWALNKMEQRNNAQFNKLTFKVADEDKRIASGYAMVADLPIYRYDEQVGDHYVVFRKPTIEKIVNKFMRQGLNSEINLMHNSPVKDVYVFESLLIDKDRGVTAPDGFQDAPDGSWFVSMRVDNDKVWNEIKEGKYKGFSVEGMFAKEEAIPTDEQIIDAAIDAING